MQYGGFPLYNGGGYVGVPVASFNAGFPQYQQYPSVYQQGFPQYQQPIYVSVEDPLDAKKNELEQLNSKRGDLQGEFESIKEEMAKAKKTLDEVRSYKAKIQVIIKRYPEVEAGLKKTDEQIAAAQADSNNVSALTETLSAKEQELQGLKRRLDALKRP
eukprot:CAMPEP_0113668096 /NCGR_PEP_ID=MMETSP0038_2-20120614/3807_1 /TAXON_ID=2898 /ORGANISM="Cryptomonas paramecium" /LENGTH=158 /DNA_ID=CAMNT_0000583795 /DNA_START=20 /DNA_END=496 /DNA_ORIENTATION=- /assembly_acc=CAM_ASM_000170